MEIDGMVLEVKETPYISPSALNEWQSCPKRYWFSHVLHHPHNINSGMAIGKHVHRIEEKMWKLDPDKELIIPSYVSYQQCVNCAGVGTWKRFYAGEKNAERLGIEWGEYDGNGYSPWLIGRIAETAGLIYTRAITDGPPLRAEFEIKVEYPTVRILSILDDLRRGENGKGIVIIDHKSGYENFGGHYAKKNYQLTMNGMCVVEALQHPNTEVSRLFPEYRGISLDDFLNDVLIVKINDIFPRTRKGEDRLPNTTFHPAGRKKIHCNSALQCFQQFYTGLKNREFIAIARDCNKCFFAEVCDDYDPAEYYYESSKEELPLPLFTPKINPHFSELIGLGIVKEEFGQNRKKPKQKTFRFPKNQTS
jgi:hypothetical protein